MRIVARLVAVLLLVSIATVAAFADSKVVYRWVLTGLPMPKINSILIIAVLENYLIRQELEDKMESLLAKEKVKGVQSHMVLPPRNEMMPGELKERIKESGADAVLVIRPKAVRSETEEVVTGGVYIPPPGYYNFWPYWNTVYGTFHATSSYTQENVIVRAEFNLYNTQDEKLLWSGETDTVYSKDFDKLGKNYAELMFRQMKKDKVITKK